MFNELPGWVIPLASSICTGLGTLLAAILSYRHNLKKIGIEQVESAIKLKEVDIAELKAIAEGNKALREALIERVNSYETTFTVIRNAHQECERRLSETENQLRGLKRRISSLEDTRKNNERPENISD